MKAGWHHQCHGHEPGQTLGDSEGQGGLECYSPRSHKGLDTTATTTILMKITGNSLSDPFTF